MKHILKLSTWLLLSAAMTVYAAAPKTTKEDYFESIMQIQQLATNAAPIFPVSVVEKQYVLGLMKQQGILNGLKLTHSGRIENHFGDTVDLYRGDFSNQGAIEYLLITILIYKLIDQKKTYGT